jgi:hypothetical protein
VRRHLMCAGLAYGALFGGSSALKAQACRPADSGGQFIVGGLRSMMTSSFPQVIAGREMLKLPLVAASSIVFVTNDTAYANQLQVSGLTTSGRVYAVKVGTVYVVQDPTILLGEYRLNMVITEQGVVLYRSSG